MADAETGGTLADGRRLELVLHSIGDGLIALDRVGRIVFTNRAGARLLDLLGSSQVGEVLTRLGEMPLASLLGPPPPGRGGHEVAVDAPQPFIFEVAAHPMPADGQSEGWTLVVRDVTQTREMEARLRAQQRLVAVGQLASGIAHDFNNILQAMMGYAELMDLLMALPADAHQYLRGILQQGQRAVRLIRQILDFSRTPGSHRQPLAIVPLLKEGMKLLKRFLPESIQISLVMEPGDYFVSADPAQLQQVLTNLLVNARDAMPEGGQVCLRVDALWLEPGQPSPVPGMGSGDWIRIEMEDTGRGMPPELVARVFEPFFTTKPASDGSGLGLAQVYGIIQQHNGFVDVRSTQGQGTVFTIYLPALEVERDAWTEREAAGVVNGAGEVVLLVEDEDIVLQITQEALECLGYRVLTARNGREAFEVYQYHRSDIALIITDVTMPEMGGLQLIRSLRELGSTVKVVIMSGYPLQEEWRETWHDDVEAWATKPLGMNQLGEIVQDALTANGRNGCR